ncbi:thiamine pyrophosphate-dependent enzyme, partial [Parageobacillus toebii]|uniref:thiamine pyrophosphate-dependent enzyme n=1 Tax=Parageobacillus toebii TaxID=153151 RepID=UPI0035B50C4A
LPEEGVQEIVDNLVNAKSPLVITSYLGRNTEAVNELIRLSDRLSIPVIESVPNYMNFPSNHPMHCGYLWNSQEQNDLLSRADVVLILDSDVPWIPLKNKPSEHCKIYYIDVDPLKEQMPLWYIPSQRFFRADSYTALQQLNRLLERTSINQEVVCKRYKIIEKIHYEQRKNWREQEQYREDVITPEYLTACVREIVDENTIIVNEGISNYEAIYRHIQVVKPGSIIGSGAGSLGWNGGASIGVKLAMPDKKDINLTGDGSYLFSIPSTVHWMARRYQTPFLTVIYNNRGWKSPKLSTLGVHPEGIASKINEFWVSFEPSADLAKIAEAAGGAYAQTVTKPSELKKALQNGLQALEEGRSAVLDVYIPSVKEE